MSEDDRLIDVVSPPYPSVNVSAVQLFALADKLRDWLAYYRKEVVRVLNPEASTVPAVQPLPSRDVFLALPLARLTHLVSMLIHARIEWDGIVRVHEVEWGTPRAMECVWGCVQRALNTYNLLLLPGEQYEAKIVEHVKELQAASAKAHLVAALQHFKTLREAAQQAQASEEHGNGPSEEDES